MEDGRPLWMVGVMAEAFSGEVKGQRRYWFMLEEDRSYVKSRLGGDMREVW